MINEESVRKLTEMKMGASGNGKTWLSNALGVQACRQHHKVKYVRLPELLDEFMVAKNEADGSFRKLLNRYKRVELLIIDEWLLTTLPAEHVYTLFEIIEARLKTTSTIFVLKLPLKDGMRN